MRSLGQNSMVLGLRHALSAFHTLEATANIGQPCWNACCSHCTSCLTRLCRISTKDIGSDVQAVRVEYDGPDVYMHLQSLASVKTW